MSDRPGVEILDVGDGRTPRRPPAWRPARIHVVIAAAVAVVVVIVLWPAPGAVDRVGVPGVEGETSRARSVLAGLLDGEVYTVAYEVVMTDEETRVVRVCVEVDGQPRPLGDDADPCAIGSPDSRAVPVGDGVVDVLLCERVRHDPGALEPSPVLVLPVADEQWLAVRVREKTAPGPPPPCPR